MTGLVGGGGGDAVGLEATAHRGGQAGCQPDDQEREEDADREDLSGVLEGLVHAAAGATVARGRLFITAALLGEANMPIEIPFSSRIAAKAG